MKRLSFFHALAALAMLGRAGATVIHPGLSNPGFELGLADWSTTVSGSGGNVSVFTSTLALDGLGFDGFVSWAPVESGHFAVLRGGATNVYQKLTSAAFVAAAGDHVVFSVFLDITEEPDYLPLYNDDGYAKLVNATTLAATTLFAASVATLPHRGNTGWVSIDYVIPAAGSYRLEFGVRNVTDFGLSPIMGVDCLSLPDPDAPLRITSVTEGEMHIHFTALPGLAYTIQYKSALTDPAWLHLADIASPAAVQAIDYNDTSVGTIPQRFYRIVTPPVP